MRNPGRWQTACMVCQGLIYRRQKAQRLKRRIRKEAFILRVPYCRTEICVFRRRHPNPKPALVLLGAQQRWMGGRTDIPLCLTRPQLPLLFSYWQVHSLTIMSLVLLFHFPSCKECLQFCSFTLQKTSHHHSFICSSHLLCPAFHFSVISV